MTWLTFVLASLATYRVARMIAQEDGAFDVFAQLRGRVGQRTWVGRGLHCVMCVSFNLALFAALYIVWSGQATWIDFPLAWLGIAGGAVVMYQVVR